MSVSARISLQNACRGLEQQTVTFVGHSIGLTFNIAFGSCHPVRRMRKMHRRFRGGYVPKSNRDIFIWASDWRLTGLNGYVLTSRDMNRRIAKEISALEGKKTLSIGIEGPQHRLQIQFDNGMRLRLLGDKNGVQTTDEKFGWELTGFPGLRSKTCLDPEEIFQ